MMASPVIQSPPEVTSNGSPNMKGSKAMEINNEEKDNSSAGSLDETNTQYLNNAHGQPMANGTTQPNYDNDKISELQQTIQQKDKKIKELEARNKTIMQLKKTIEQTFKDRMGEAETQMNQLAEDIDKERNAKLDFQSKHEQSRQNLLLFEENNISVESHLAIHRRVKEMEAELAKFQKFDQMNMENDEKYLNEAINNYGNNDKSILITLQRTVADRDNLVYQLQSFKTEILKRITVLRNQVETEKNSNKSEIALRELQDSFNKLKNDYDYRISSHNKQIEKLNNQINGLQREKNRANQKLNEQKTQMTKHKQDLSKQKIEYENSLERSTIEQTQLQEQLKKLQTKLEEERSAWEEERNNRVNLKEQNARAINIEKKKVSQQLDKEQEFRISLEHKLQQSKDIVKKKESLVSKLNTNMKTMQMELELKEKKCQEYVNEQKILKRKYEEAASNEKNANGQLLAITNELKDTQASLKHAKEDNAALHEAMRKKDSKLKVLQEKESQITKMQNNAADLERKAKLKFDNAKKYAERVKQKPDYKNQSTNRLNRRGQATWLARNDPLNEYKNILPFHYISLLLAFLLFILICRQL